MMIYMGSTESIFIHHYFSTFFFNAKPSQYSLNNFKSVFNKLFDLFQKLHFRLATYR